MGTSTPSAGDALRPGLPPLIPRSILFGNPVRTSPRLSPDGRHLAYLAPDDRGVLQVRLRTLGRQDDRTVTADQKRGIRAYRWTYDGEHLVYLQDAGGDENWHVYAVSLMSGVVRDLTPYQGVQAQIQGVSPDMHGEMLVALNLTDRRRHDIYRVNLANGAAELDTKNPGNVIIWAADRRLRVRAAVVTNDEGGQDLLVRATTADPWRTLLAGGPEGEVAWAGYTGDGRSLYVVTNHGSNTLRLVEVDPETGGITVLAEDPCYDVGLEFSATAMTATTLMHPTTRAVQAVAFRRDRLEWQALDPDVAPDLAALSTLHRGDWHVVSRTLDDTTWLVQYAPDDGSVYYYTYDRARRAASPLFSQQPALEGLPLARMESIAYPARDGLTIQGYLTLPVGLAPRGLPTVLLVHGGPWARDTWGNQSQVQWLANRGYAVLQVNYRGSRGYGSDFLHAGDREWGGKIQQDQVDGVHWLIAQGIADPTRVAIMGASFGGFSTLVGLTFHPDVYAAGVDIVGPSNIISLIQSAPPYWKPLVTMFHQRIGHPERDAEFLRSRSPLFHADRIRAPLLVAQGANDPRVPQAESDQIVEAVRRSGKEVQYVVYADEGHGLARPANRQHFFALAEAFLARHLGGRCEPPEEVQGHSGEMR